MQKVVSLIIIVLVAFSGLTSHAQIYKTVDADGNVVFTDVPPKDESKAVKLDAYNTYSEPVSSAPTSNRAAEPAIEEEEEDNTPNYSELRITWPADDEAVRENAGNVSVKVKSDPELDPTLGHSVRILVDGTASGDAGSNAIALSNVDRGTHSLVAQIIDADGNVLVASSPVTFHMLRAVAPQFRINKGS